MIHQSSFMVARQAVYTYKLTWTERVHHLVQAFNPESDAPGLLGAVPGHELDGKIRSFLRVKDQLLRRMRSPGRIQLAGSGFGSSACS
jgi:hypothetical protein